MAVSQSEDPDAARARAIAEAGCILRAEEADRDAAGAFLSPRTSAPGGGVVTSEPHGNIRSQMGRTER
jgi:hypothetical protein